MSPILKTALLAAGAAFALLGAAGCSNNEPPPPTVVTTTPPPAPIITTTPPPTETTPASGAAPATKVNVNAGPGGSQGADSPVAEAVNKAIVTNKEMTGSRIEVVVDAAGIATLTGTTQNQQQKALAARAATNTPGVTGVKNKIEIVATGGAKSPASPKTVTKVIVVHEKAPVPAPDSSTAPATSTNPSPPDAPNGANGNSSDTNSTNNGGSSDTTTGTPTTTNNSGQ